MKKREKKRRGITGKIVSCIFVGCLLGLLTMSIESNGASGINSAEQRVISAAKRTFKYRGKYYKAKSEYLAKCITYLNEEVDLTEEQASEAISQMNWNVGDGVAKGYLYEVESQETETITKEPQENQSSTETEEVKENEDGQGVEENTSSVEGESPSSEIEKPEVGTNSNQEGSNEEDSSTPSKDKDDRDTVSSTIDEKNPSNTVTTEKWEKIEQILSKDLEEVSESQVVAERPNESEALYSLEYDTQSGTLSKKNEQSERIVDLSLYKRIGTILSCIIFSLLLVCIGCLAINRSFIFQAREKNGHKKRKRVRKITRPIVAIILGIYLCSLFVIMSCQVALSSENAILTNLDSSGFYRNTYQVLYYEVQDILQEHELDSEELKDVITYEQYLVAAKNKSISLLQKKKETASLKNMKGQLEKVLGKEENSHDVIEDILAVYKKRVEGNITAYILDVKARVLEVFQVIFPVSIIGVILAIGTLLGMDRYRHRGIRTIAWTELVAATIFTSLTIGMFLIKPHTKLYITPDYLYKFFVAYIQWGLKVMGTISGAGLMIGLVLLLVARQHRHKKVHGAN